MKECCLFNKDCRDFDPRGPVDAHNAPVHGNRSAESTQETITRYPLAV